MKKVEPCNKKIDSVIKVVGDKSQTHRALMLSAIANCPSTMYNANICKDTLSTINCLNALGAKITIEADCVKVSPIKKANDNVLLDCGNSGTTARLLAGIVSGLNIHARFIGDASLSRRPMRVVEYLQQLNCNIDFAEDCLFEIKPSKLVGAEIKLLHNSAQVESCLLFAGLFAQGRTRVIACAPMRNHSQIMLKYLGANIVVDGLTTTICSCTLSGRDLTVGGDMSCVGYYIALIAGLHDSSLTLKDVNVNPTRAGLIDILTKSNLPILYKNVRTICGEQVADIQVASCKMSPFVTLPSNSAILIDEMPTLAIIACLINGVSVISNVGELKYKESNRIKQIIDMLNGIGCKCQLDDDNITVFGNGKILGGKVNTFGDHRIAMCGYIAGLLSKDGVVIDDIDCIEVSYPNFIEDINSL